MRKIVPLLSVAIGLAMAATPVAAATASPAPAPCDISSNCWWSGTNFDGASSTWQYVKSPGCDTNPNPNPIRSYAFYGGQEGYFYSGRNCDGQRKIATYDSESADLGFDAHSFKAACVSCRDRDR